MYVQLQLSAQNVAELQQNQDLRVQSGSELQTGLPTAVRMSHPESATGSTTSPASQTPTHSSDSTSSTQFSTQRPRSSFNPTGSTSHSYTTARAVTCHHHSSPLQSCPTHPAHTSSTSISNLSLASGCPHPSCPLQAAAPARSPGYIPGPRSPAAASSIKEVSLCISQSKLQCIVMEYY